jgi:phage terminase small subunit
VRGRKPKPLSLQIADGDTRKRGVRKLREQLAAEPKAARGLPDCPHYLSGYARHAWNVWKEDLASMDLDRRPDALTLEMCCIAYAAVRSKYRKKDYDGMDKHLKTVRSFQSEFGLSPVSRTRLTIEKPDNGEKDLMAMLSAPRMPRKTAVQ